MDTSWQPNDQYWSFFVKWIVKNSNFHWHLVSSLSEAVEVIETAEVLRPGKSLRRTSVIHVVKFSFICMFYRKKFWVESQNIPLNFSTFSVGGCWGQPMLLFWKLVDETQMVKPPEPTSHHNSRKYLILLPLRAIYFTSLHYETPCRYILCNFVSPLYT